MKRVAAVPVVLLICCAAAASASADTFCVVPETSCPAGNTYPHVQPALDQAAMSSGNTVKLGAATYSDGPFTAGGANPVSVVGHGSGQSVLTISGSQSGKIVLALGSGSTLSDSGLVIPQGNMNIGLSLAGTAERIAISTASGSTQGTGVSNTLGNGTIEDSTVTATNGLTVSTFESFAFLTARHDTFIGDGSSGSVGASATATGFTFGGVSSVTVNDSIVRGFATDLQRQGSAAGGGCFPNPCQPSPASITYGSDDFDPGTPKTDVGPGQYNDNGQNQNVDPKFIAQGANPPDYHLAYNSPLIDKGMTSVESGPPAESTQDADGNPRAVDGNGDGTVATDIGAYEYQHRPPVVTAGATPSSAQIATPFTFTASATDPDPGDAVTVTWTFDDGATGSGDNVTHAFSTAGTHTATATATDPTGLTTVATVTVTVATPTGATGPTGPTGPTAKPPILSHLKLAPTAFRAATSGGSIAHAKKRKKTGTTISYADTQAADTTFIVYRAVPGIKRGRSCVKPRQGSHSRIRRSKRCTLFVRVQGGFLHRDVVGANRFHFTGRVNGKALSPGNYRLNAEAENSALLVGNLLEKQFRIIR